MTWNFGFLVIVLFVSVPAFSHAEPFRFSKCETRPTMGWNFYCRDPEPESDPVDVVPPLPQVSDVPIPDPSLSDPESATEEMMAFRAEVDEIKYRAVLDPTPENVLAYMEINKLIADRAGDFAEQWQRVLFNTPHLNANVDSPLAAAGISVFQDQMKAAREAAFLRVASTSGILFLFDGDDRCGVCRVQGQILAQMQEHFGVSILAISMDGGTNSHFPDAVYDDGRLETLGLAGFPAPTLALVDPDSGDIALMGSGLITAEQVLERVFLITEVPVGEQY